MTGSDDFQPLQEDELALRYLQAQRHVFMNRLQVVLGWLQLQEHDRAQRAVEDLRERFQAEARLLQLLPHAAAAFLLGSAVLTEERGVTVRYVLDEGEVAGLPRDWPSFRVRLAEGWQRLIDAGMQRARGEGLVLAMVGTRLLVSLYPVAGVAEQVPLAAGVEPEQAAGGVYGGGRAGVRYVEADPPRLDARFPARREGGA